MGVKNLLKKLYGDDATIAEIVAGTAIPRLHFSTHPHHRHTCVYCGVSLYGLYPPPWTEDKDMYDKSPYKCGG